MRRVRYSCGFVPAEWVAAHGLVPCRVIPLVNPRASRLAVAGMCPYARAFAEAALDAGDDLVVFTTTCDQMRRLGDLVGAEAGGRGFVLNVPATAGSGISGPMYLAELKRLGRFLERNGGHAPGHDELVGCILRSEAGGPAGGPAAAGGRIRLAVAGGPLHDPGRFAERLAALGGELVLDATDGGERVRRGRVDRARLAQDPLAELARAHLDMPSVHQRPNDRLLAWMRDRLRAHGVEGLILRRYVWCDLWHAEVARLAEVAGVPLLDLQIESEDDDSRRLAGRIESFIEMLGAAKCP
jgi:benzoyl-CoA reductase/2-hydroxyglutaryl-CoA dehydratase subunit BcrC/BadD/HgdB